MAYDPTWDMPQPNWVQQGSFESGEIPPSVEPDAGTQICIGPVAQEWLPVILGALDQLRNPSSWLVADDAAMYTTLRRVDKLREIIAVSEGCHPSVLMRLTDTCVLQYSNDGGVNWVDTTDWVTNFGNCIRSNVPVPVPIDPDPSHKDQHACNIAGYLAQKFIEITMVKVVSYVGTSGEQLAFANSVMGALAGVFPLTAGFVNGLYRFYNLVTAQLLTEVESARDDPTLWSEVTCVIYQAIRSVGYVDGSNFAAVQTGLYAISYPSFWVPIALGNYWGDLGLEVIQELQNVGAIDVIDCSGCSGAAWCHYIDFTLNDGGAVLASPTQSGVYVPGQGWASTATALTGIDEVYIAIDAGIVVNITEVQVHYRSTSGLTSGRPHEAGVQTGPFTSWVCVANTAFNDASNTPVWDSVSTVCSGRYIAVALDGAIGGGSPPTTYILGMQIRGTGVNPFGFGDCVVGP